MRNSNSLTRYTQLGLVASLLGVLLAGCGAGKSAATDTRATGTDGFVTGTCSSGAAMVPSLTLAELAPYVKTYTGNEGNYATTAPFAFVSTGPAVLVVKADGTLTYNGAVVTYFGPVCKASTTSINFTFKSATLQGVVTLNADGTYGVGGLTPAGGGAATVQIVSPVVPVSTPPAQTAAQKFAAYGALFAGTYTGVVDKNANFTAVGSTATCSLTIAANGTTTYNGSSGNTKVITPGVDLPPATSNNLDFNFPATAPAIAMLDISMGPNTSTAQSGQVIGKNVFFYKSSSPFGTEEYCLDLK